MWVIHAILVHLALIGSVFVIYFRSPVITGLEPTPDLKSTPPAKRLVLIVTDGLRAESFFRNQCQDIPHICRLIKTRGILGVSRTRVPTESRPGHIAMISGLYEDPSAVLRGWKSNPIDFDNLFNRSSKAFAWGDVDVLSIFSKITAGDKLVIDIFESYDFSGAEKVTVVDDWVFERVKQFLERKSVELKDQTRIVFFLHLLGLDTAGHVHKPGTKLFLEALHSTEKGVFEMYQTFERAFPDGKTAYVLTSDHGMTNHGSHGDGDAFETDTPLYVWGAGVNNWGQLPTLQKAYFQIDGLDIPLFIVEQAQLTPLMSALIGLSPPMNNFGVLPKGVLNVSEEYKAQAVHSNALQLIAQFESLLNAHNRGAFSRFMYSYKFLDEDSIKIFRREVANSIKHRRYAYAVQKSYEIMELALEGIDYYQNYYHKVLLLCTSLTFLIWLSYLLSLSMQTVSRRTQASYVRPAIAGGVVFVVICLQKIPVSVGFYILLPLVMWMLLLYSTRGDPYWFTALLTREVAMMGLILVVASSLLVISFFQRPYITVLFLLFTWQQSRSMQRKGIKFYTWLVLSLIIAMFPLHPPAVGATNNLWLAVGTILTLGRGFLVKSNLPKWVYGVAVAALLNAWYCIILHTNHEPTFLICRMFSWLFVGYSLVMPFYAPYSNRKAQVELLFFTLTSAYLPLCTNYEAVLVILLGSQLMLTLSLSRQLPEDHFNVTANEDLKQSFQLAWTILLYTFFLLFGTGNIASLSSFDPNVMRCFLATFSRTIISVLVVLKLVLPMLLNLIIIYGTVGPELKERQVFIMLLFVCDVMGLCFLYLVRNKGSWMEIGSSISHFIIMEVTTLVLVIAIYIVKLYLRMSNEINGYAEKST